MLCLLFPILTTLIRDRAALVAENLALRHQLAVLRREHPERPKLRAADRALWAFLLRRWSRWREVLLIVRPETVVAWHRRGFRLFWRRLCEGGRPATAAEIRDLVRRMARENPTWGASRIHGELGKLGYRCSERTVSRFVQRFRPGPIQRHSQTWATFLKNEAAGIVAADMFTIPTATFRILYVFVILAVDRRKVLWSAVTEHPTAEWLAQQLTNAFPWSTAPKFLIHDRDSAFGAAFGRRLKHLGITEVRTAVRAPKMNSLVERFIGTARRECFDYVILRDERHAKEFLDAFVRYYNADRTHRSLEKDSPDGRPVEMPAAGPVVAHPRLNGLHHRYLRRAA